MFEKMFELGILISVKDMFTPGFMKATAGMDVLQKQAAETQKRLDGFKSMAAVGAGITALGAGMAFGLVKAAESAGKLQTAVLGVANAMKLTKGQQAQLTNMSMTQGIQTAFSAVQTAQLYQAMSKGGFTNSMIFNKALSDQMIKFADVQYLSGNQDPQTTVTAATGMAHVYQLYHSKQLSGFLNTLNAALAHTHMGVDQFATQFRYFAGTANNKNVTAQQALMDEMFLSRMGVGGGGRSMGTSFNDFLMRMTGTASKAAQQAMVTAGFMQNGQSVFTTGKSGSFVGIPQAIKIMDAFKQRFGGNATTEDKLLQTIFGTQGLRVADALMTKNNGAANQYSLIQHQMGQTASVNTMQKAYNVAFFGQAKQAETTFEDIGQAFGQQLLPMLTKVLNVINQITGSILKWMIAHPAIVKVAAAITTVATAAALVIGPLMTAVGVIGYLKTSGIAASAISGIGEAFTGLGSTLLDVALGPVGIAIAAVILLYEAFSHNFLGIRTKTMQAWGYLKTETPKVWNSVQHVVTGVWAKISPTVDKAANAVWGSVKGSFTQVSAFVKKIWPEVSQITTAVWKFMHDFITAELQLVWIVVKTVAQGIWVTLQAAWTIISTEVKVAWALIVDVIKLAWTLVSGVVEIGLDLLTGHWKQTWVDFKNLLGTGWSEITKLFDDLWNGLGQIAASYVTAAAQWGSGIVTALWHGIQSLWPWLQHSFTTLLSDILPKWALKDLGLSVTASSVPTQASRSNYAQLSPGATGGGDIHIHNNIHPGAIQVTAAAGHETQAGNAVYSAITKRAVTASRSRGIRPATSFAH